MISTTTRPLLSNATVLRIQRVSTEAICRPRLSNTHGQTAPQASGLLAGSAQGWSGRPARLGPLQPPAAGSQGGGALTAKLSASQATTSKHLQSLHAAGLLTRERHGNSVFYSVADPAIFKLCDLVCRTTARSARAKYSALLER